MTNTKTARNILVIALLTAIAVGGVLILKKKKASSSEPIVSKPSDVTPAPVQSTAPAPVPTPAPAPETAPVQSIAVGEPYRPGDITIEVPAPAPVTVPVVADTPPAAPVVEPAPQPVIFSPNQPVETLPEIPAAPQPVIVPVTPVDTTPQFPQPEIFPVACDSKIDPNCGDTTKVAPWSQGEIYFAYTAGGTCNSSDFQTLFWEGGRRLYTGLQFYTDASLTTPWENSQNWNYCNFIGGDGREFDFQGGAGSSVVGNETGIGC